MPKYGIRKPSETLKGTNVIRLLFVLLSFVLLLDACTDPQPQPVFIETPEKLIIQCDPNCDNVAKKVIALNGDVKIRYRNVAALAVEVPISNVAILEKLAGVKLRKQTRIALPDTKTARHNLVRVNNTNLVPLDTKTTLDSSKVGPRNYLFNNITNGVANLHLQDITGKGVIVAVIDSGTANNPDVVPALAGSVIGGENFIDLPDEPSATSTLNADHGTMVASMIAAHLGIVVANDRPIVQSLQTHAPQSIFPFDADNSLIPMLGTAPDASLYPLKVFAASQDGTPDSIVIAAMDRALTLKKNYDDGMSSEPVSGDGSEDNPFVYDALNIQVVNLSLGGYSLFPGNDVADLLILEMLKQGITVVTAAGNEGFGAMTGGSPGTSTGTINVGAANSPVHERVLRDLQEGPGMGVQFRPNDILQTAFFSSRGPTADGRVGIDLVANGFASFVQAANGDLALVAGTSFSSPTVAGAAALLWSANSANGDISATQIRKALIDSANPALLGNAGDQAIDRGNGYLDAEAALTLLSTLSDVNSPRPPRFEDQPSSVLENIQDLNLNIVDTSDGGVFTATVDLNPGEAINFLVPTTLNTAQLTVKMRDIKAELAPEQQNVLFGDAFFFQILDAPTSINDLLVDERLVDGDADMTFPIPLPQSGLLRVAALGDWTNAGRIHATLEISATQRQLPEALFDGSMRDEQADSYRIRVRTSTTQLNFELSWGADWASYPPHDIDLILVDPDGNYIFDAATLDIPERLTVDTPTPGNWDIIVAAYMLHGFKDEYELRITDQDGRSLDD